VHAQIFFCILVIKYISDVEHRVKHYNMHSYLLGIVLTFTYCLRYQILLLMYFGCFDDVLTNTGELMLSALLPMLHTKPISPIFMDMAKKADGIDAACVHTSFIVHVLCRTLKFCSVYSSNIALVIVSCLLKSVFVQLGG